MCARGWLNRTVCRATMFVAMQTLATIATPGTCHNSPRLRLARLMFPVLALGLGWLSLTAMGCSGPRRSGRTVGEVPAWQLAGAAPSTIHPLGRSRVDVDRQVPANLVTPLCEEFSLLLVGDETSWSLLCSRCQLHTALHSLDFDNGAVVGLIADVGECASGDWPIRLQVVRVLDGEGWLEFSFGGGIYYPVKTAGYLELAYVPGLRSVQTVQVGRRSFILRPSGSQEQQDSSWSFADP